MIAAWHRLLETENIFHALSEWISVNGISVVLCSRVCVLRTGWAFWIVGLPMVIDVVESQGPKACPPQLTSQANSPVRPANDPGINRAEEVPKAPHIDRQMHVGLRLPNDSSKYSAVVFRL